MLDFCFENFPCWFRQPRFEEWIKCESDGTFLEFHFMDAGAAWDQVRTGAWHAESGLLTLANGGRASGRDRSFAMVLVLVEEEEVRVLMPMEKLDEWKFRTSGFDCVTSEEFEVLKSVVYIWQDGKGVERMVKLLGLPQ